MRAKALTATICRAVSVLQSLLCGAGSGDDAAILARERHELSSGGNEWPG
jgi:hypothetical protein